ETWSAAETILRASEHGISNIMSVSLMRMGNGDLGIFYIVKETPEINRIFLTRSSDEGKSFPSRTECTLRDRQGYYIINNDRAVRLSSGRIVLPLALHAGGYSPSSGRYFDGRAADLFLLSDDDGITWRESTDRIYPPFTGTRTGLQEPGIVELANGALWGYARTDMMFQYGFYSMDGGEHWTMAQPTRFTSPNSPMKIARDPYTGFLHAVWNPIPVYNGRKLSGVSWGRTPLAHAESRDEGETWSDIDYIASEEDHGYCYPSVFFTEDGCMLLSYCAGGPADGSPLCRTDIVKVRL
ncbi:MAG: exo-alpha-sialidase, partial [Clostridia bacterium]|nr:exo-alpha-sialidase [Clostridia bacterium]